MSASTGCGHHVYPGYGREGYPKPKVSPFRFCSVSSSSRFSETGDAIASSMIIRAIVARVTPHWQVISQTPVMYIDGDLALEGERMLAPDRMPILRAMPCTADAATERIATARRGRPSRFTVSPACCSSSAARWVSAFSPRCAQSRRSRPKTPASPDRRGCNTGPAGSSGNIPGTPRSWRHSCSCPTGRCD
jgi:hypothetical protein